MANTNAIWQQAAHTTYKLSPPWNFNNNNNKSISEEQNLVRETILSGHTWAPVHMSTHTLYTIYKQLK